MPDPNRFKTKNAFMKACVPVVLQEGNAKDTSQAVAICISMWENKKKKKTK